MVSQPPWLETALRHSLPGRISKCLQSHTFCVTGAKGNLALPELSGTAAFIPSSVSKDSEGFLRDGNFNTLSVRTPAFLSRLFPILPSSMPEQHPVVWQCLNLSPLSKSGPATLPDAMMLVSALDDEGSPRREEQPAGF